MITFRKRFELEVDRSTAPQPPFCTAATIRPYRNRSTLPFTIDYEELTAFAHDPRETWVTHDVRDQLERESRLAGPLLIDATGALERIFRRGEVALRYCAEQNLESVFLLSSDGVVPSDFARDSTTLALAAWPLQLDRISELFAALGTLDCRWGVVLPIVLTITTELSVVAELADLASKAGASFLTGLPIDLDPTAKRQIAAVAISSDDGDDSYSALFGDQLEPLIVATERHIAAVAAEKNMRDFVELPREDRRDNWMAASFLARVAQRMFRMEKDIELAWAIHRSSRLIAELGKRIDRVAESASLSIIEGLDPASLDLLSEWLRDGESGFQRQIEERWRLRRDLYR